MTGGNSDGGDDETLTVDLSKVDPRIQEIIFTVTIHEAEQRRQNFGQVHNSYIRIYNALTNEEIAKYDLDEDFSIETAVKIPVVCIVVAQNGNSRLWVQATRVAFNSSLTNT